MTIDEAAHRLREMYENPATGRAVSVHLFGVRYAEELQGMNLRELAELAGISKSYGTEIRKGMNLSAYVIER